MATTNFIDQQTVIEADWLNDVDFLLYDLLSNPATLAALRTNAGLEIGTDVQAYDAGLADIAGLAVTDGNIIVGDGNNWVAESGATARASLSAQEDVITTRGDIVRGSSGSVAERLALGASGTVLGSDGTDAAWVEAAWHLLERLDLTNGGADDLAAADFSHTLEDGYYYMVKVRDLSGTSSWVPKMQMYNDADTLLSSSGDYYMSAIVNATTGFNNTAADSLTPYNYSGFTGLTASQSLDLTATFIGAMDTAVRTSVLMDCLSKDSTSVARGMAAGTLEAIDGHDTIRIVVSPGTMDGGEAFLYRIKEPS